MIVLGQAVSIWLAVAFLVALSFGLSRSRAGLLLGLAASAAPLMYIVARIIVDLSRDSTTHNLFPIELLVGVVLGLPPALGLLAGYVAGKLRVPAKAAWASACLAVLLALLSPTLSRTLETSHQTDAIGTLKKLWQAEKTFAASDPHHRFTCEGPRLPGFEHEPWFARTQLGLNNKDQMHLGPYWFTVRCGALSRGDHFEIIANAGPGRDLYCIDEIGMIHSSSSEDFEPCKR